MLKKAEKADDIEIYYLYINILVENIKGDFTKYFAQNQKFICFMEGKTNGGFG